MPAPNWILTACLGLSPALFPAITAPPPRPEASCPRVQGPLRLELPDPALGSSLGGPQARLRTVARQAPPEARAVDSLPACLQGRMQTVAGWKLFMLRIPARHTLWATVTGPGAARFRLSCVDDQGHLLAGMPLGLGPADPPVLRWTAPSSRTSRVYVVLDTRMVTTFNEAFTLVLDLESADAP